MSISEIEGSLRTLSRAFQTSLSDEEIESLVQKIAAKYAPAVRVWDLADPAQAIAKIENLMTLVLTLRRLIHDEEYPPKGHSTDPDRLRRLTATLAIVRAEQKKRQ